MSKHVSDADGRRGRLRSSRSAAAAHARPFIAREVIANGSLTGHGASQKPVRAFKHPWGFQTGFQTAIVCTAGFQRICRGFADTHGPANNSTRAPVANFQPATLQQLPAGEGVPITTFRHPDFARLWVSCTPNFARLWVSCTPGCGCLAPPGCGCLAPHISGG